MGTGNAALDHLHIGKIGLKGGQITSSIRADLLSLLLQLRSVGIAMTINKV
jgi:hypothetical protein